MVRRALVAHQQTLGAHGGVVAEGRDMGSVVFPNAELKVRMVADLDVRTQRRLDELVATGIAQTLMRCAPTLQSAIEKTPSATMVPMEWLPTTSNWTRRVWI